MRVPTRYRTAALRFVKKHLADLPAERRRQLVDELEAALAASNSASYANRAKYMRDYMRDYMRKRRASGKA